MLKRYRFENGFVGTLVEFGQKYGKAKMSSFKSARRPVSGRRYNRMSYDQQMEYDHAARFAVPSYHLVLADESSYELSKKEYDALDLPIEQWLLCKDYPMKAQKHMICFYYSVDANRYVENTLQAAMQLYAKDAKKMAVALLYASGYIHTGNYQHYKVKVSINHTDVNVTVIVQKPETVEERYEFRFSSTLSPSGCSYCRLDMIYRHVGEEKERLFNRGGANWYEGDFNRYVSNIYFNQEVGNASELG